MNFSPAILAAQKAFKDSEHRSMCRAAFPVLDADPVEAAFAATRAGFAALADLDAARVRLS